MTEPRDPGDVDPAGVPPDREPRRGRHWAPDEDDVTDGGPSDDPTGEKPVPDEVDPDEQADPTDDQAAPDEFEPDPDGPQDDSTPDEVVQDDDGADAGPARVVAAAGERSGPRHAASGSGFRLQPWMLAVCAVVVIALIAWLVIGLTTGDDSANEAPPTEETTSAAAPTTTEAPEPVDPVSLPQVLCMGQSYAMLQTGQSAEQLLADPAAVEAQYPGSKLSTIPPGCIADSDQRDEVVLALGPFPTLQEACDAGKSAGVGFTAYEGSADAGLEAASCPA